MFLEVQANSQKIFDVVIDFHINISYYLYNSKLFKNSVNLIESWYPHEYNPNENSLIIMIEGSPN